MRDKTLLYYTAKYTCREIVPRCVMQFDVIVTPRARRFRSTCRSTYRREKYGQRLLDTTSNGRNIVDFYEHSWYRVGIATCRVPPNKHERRTPCTLLIVSIHSIRGPSLTLQNFLPTDQSIFSSASAVAESLAISEQSQNNLRDILDYWVSFKCIIDQFIICFQICLYLICNNKW